MRRNRRGNCIHHSHPIYGHSHWWTDLNTHPSGGSAFCGQGRKRGENIRSGGGRSGEGAGDDGGEAGRRGVGGIVEGRVHRGISSLSGGRNRGGIVWPRATKCWEFPRE